MEGKKKLFHSRTFKYGSNTALRTVIFTAILVFVVLIVQNHPWRVDLTESKEFTLTDQTQKILKSIKIPITIKAFYQEATRDRIKAQDLLDTYKYYCPNLKYEFIDPDRHPEIAKHYDVKTYGTVVVEGAGRKQTITLLNEENLTNALMKLIQTKKKVIYFVTGHGEASINDFDKNGYSMVRRELEKENYEVKTLDLLHTEKIPDDASVVIINGPKKALMKPEIETLRKYLDSGGKLIVMLDPFYDGGLKNFLKDYGIGIKNDIVIDKLSRVFGGSYLMPVITKYTRHKITENFNIATFFPESRSLTKVEKTKPGINVMLIALTSSGAWAETDTKTLKEKNTASFDPNQDRQGPVCLVMMSEITPEKKTENKDNKKDDTGNKNKKEDNKSDKKGQLVVFGDTDFANNTYFGLSGNGDFYLNVINYLAQEENLITIERPTKKGKPLILTSTQSRMVFLIPLVLVPLFVVLCGLAVFRVRRKQK